MQDLFSNYPSEGNELFEQFSPVEVTKYTFPEIMDFFRPLKFKIRTWYFWSFSDTKPFLKIWDQKLFPFLCYGCFNSFVFTVKPLLKNILSTPASFLFRFHGILLLKKKVKNRNISRTGKAINIILFLLNLYFVVESF